VLFIIAYRDKKVVGVFVRFRAPLQVGIRDLILMLKLKERTVG
jgi:hypothetical protein